MNRARNPWAIQHTSPCDCGSHAAPVPGGGAAGDSGRIDAGQFIWGLFNWGLGFHGATHRPDQIILLLAHALIWRAKLQMARVPCADSGPSPWHSRYNVQSACEATACAQPKKLPLGLALPAVPCTFASRMRGGGPAASGAINRSYALARWL